MGTSIHVRLHRIIFTFSRREGREVTFALTANSSDISVYIIVKKQIEVMVSESKIVHFHILLNDLHGKCTTAFHQIQCHLPPARYTSFKTETIVI